MTKKQDPNRFEEFADFDTDGCVVQIGLQHNAIGPPSPAIRLNTGAIEVSFTAHLTDIDELIEGFKAARKQLRTAIAKSRR